MFTKYPDRVWIKTNDGWYSREATEYDKALRDETTSKLFGRMLTRVRRKREANDHPVSP